LRDFNATKRLDDGATKGEIEQILSSLKEMRTEIN